MPHGTAFGFLGGREVKEAGVANLGLYDRASYHPAYLTESSWTSLLLWADTERLALRWVQKYISAFGGDPEKVMMCASSPSDKPFR